MSGLTPREVSPCGSVATVPTDAESRMDGMTSGQPETRKTGQGKRVPSDDHYCISPRSLAALIFIFLVEFWNVQNFFALAVRRLRAVADHTIQGAF